MTAKDVGTYQVRVRECPECPDIEGQIVCIRGMSNDSVQISLTSDCTPLDQVITLSNKALDNGWHEVTEMVMTANMTIYPKYNECNFANSVAMEYRNFLDAKQIAAAQLSEADAVGRLCVLGSRNQRGFSFSRQVYYIVARDDDGYFLGYSGFCQPISAWDRPVVTQKVLRLLGTGKSFFDARAIVNACNEAFTEDTEKADGYIQSIQIMVSTNHMFEHAKGTVQATRVSEMHLD